MGNKIEGQNVRTRDDLEKIMRVNKDGSWTKWIEGEEEMKVVSATALIPVEWVDLTIVAAVGLTIHESPYDTGC